MVWVAIFFLLVETLSTTGQVSQKWQRPLTKGTTAHRQHLYCNPCDQAILLPFFFGKQKIKRTPDGFLYFCCRYEVILAIQITTYRISELTTQPQITRIMVNISFIEVIWFGTHSVIRQFILTAFLVKLKDPLLDSFIDQLTDLVARIILDLSYRSSASAASERLSWVNLKIRRKMHRLKFIYKCRNNLFSHRFDLRSL